ncbi:MAG TPA: class IV adenylate cyclase [Candidatus Nanoarchaeia archaeon]|nr:class IV adenylate cyclase [Candidatus Nanoarchaeia archaeon]
MEEIEVKILEINKEDIIRRLENLGAKEVFKGSMNSIYFDTKDNRLKNNKMVLRIREKGIKNFITLKVKKEDEEVKLNDEFEIEISNFAITKEILNRLELIETISDIRKRTSYKIKNSLVEIDEYEEPKIPTFLEVESPNKDELKEIVELLGFTMKDTKNWGGNRLLQFYNQRFQ